MQIGLMLDCSRNAVMTISMIKKFIDIMKKMGYTSLQLYSNKFIFENSRISAAFNKLSSKRKEILEMLFVRNLTSDEIAKEWKCSLQYVYLLRSSALTKLRDILTRGK